MKIDKQKIERVTQRLIDMLGVESYIDDIEFRFDSKSNACGHMIKDDLRHKIIINVNVCGGEKGIVHTMAHELRHVWQSVNGFDVTANYEVYRQTYNTNIYELDADRFADIIVRKKKYKANKDGLYVSNIEIAKHKANVLIAKTCA